MTVLKKWMIFWIDGDIDRLLLGAVVLFAAGAARRGWFRTSWSSLLFARDFEHKTREETCVCEGQTSIPKILDFVIPEIIWMEQESVER